MDWIACTACHVGGRQSQQDRIKVMHAGETHLLVLADGMGGHPRGDMAAQSVIDAADAALVETSAKDGHLQGLLTSILENSHASLVVMKEALGVSPGTTCVLLAIRGETACWAHIGDSRLYVLRGGRVLKRTHDHSVPQMLVDLHKLDEEAMGTHPDQGRLLRSLSADKPPNADFEQLQLEPDDVFVACSDGVWETTQSAEISEFGRVARRLESLQNLASMMVRSAVHRAGSDADNACLGVIAGRPTLSRRFIKAIAARLGR